MKKVKFLTTAGILAALYVVLSFISGAFGLSSNVFQIRISDALCIFSAFTPAGIVGVTLGCILYNLLSGALFWDVLIGSFASLIGCVGIFALSRFGFIKNKKAGAFLLPLPYIFSNTLLIPLVFVLVGIGDAYLIYAVLVFVGEFIACELLGMVLYSIVQKTVIL